MATLPPAPMTLRSLLVLAPLLVAAGLAPPPLVAPEPARAQEVDVAAEREAARRELVAGLEGLVEWCDEHRAFAARARLYGRLLRVEPDHAGARRGLGHKRQKDGSWKEPSRPRTPRDHDPEALAELAALEGEVDAAYSRRVLGLLEALPDAPPRLRRELVDDVLRSDPDDAAARALVGEARDGERWVLRETLAARARRGELKALVQRALADAPAPAPSEPLAREAAFGLPWQGVVASSEVRALSTGSVEEAERLARALPAARRFFEGALGLRARLPQGTTLLALANEGEKARFLDAHPSVDAEYRAFLEPLEGSSIRDSSDFVNWAPDPLWRLDSLVRLGIMWLFVDSCGLSTRVGWAFEGFGLYLTRELVGTRLTWFVQPSEYGQGRDDSALRARLMDTRTNWMGEAFTLLSGTSRPKLALMLGKDVNRLDTRDLLVSYALAAYLVEAEAERLPRVLGRLGKGEPSVQVLEEELGRPVTELPDHLLRWLSERR
jgi:hypothetical protein